MARRIPHVADGVLHAHEPPGAPEIAVDSPAWAAWLEDRATHSFSFEGPSGTFTARKERRAGGDAEYWSAYRKRGGKLRKVYLGKTEKLTLVRLDEAATARSGHGGKATADLSPDTISDDGRSERAGSAATKVPTTVDEHVWERPREQDYDVDSRQIAMTLSASEGEAAASPSTARGARRPRAVGNTGQRLPNNLPLELSSFVGREKELAEVKRLLEDNRLLTLTGSGGCGKTRLALAAAGERWEGLGGGVWLVERAPLADRARVARAVGATLGVREQ